MYLYTSSRRVIQCLSWLLGKYIENFFSVTFSKILKSVIILLHLVPTKARDPGLPCYLMQTQGDNSLIHVFPSDIWKKVNATGEAKFELWSSIYFSLLVTLIYKFYLK